MDWMNMSGRVDGGRDYVFGDILRTSTRAITRAVSVRWESDDETRSKLDPASKAAVFNQKGSVAVAEGKYIEAIEAYSQAITLDPTYQIYYSNRSEAYFHKGDHSNALHDGEKCIEINPNWEQGYIRKGAALHAMKLYENALMAYEEGLSRCPDDAGLSSGVAEITNIISSAESAGGGLEGAWSGKREIFFSSRYNDPRIVDAVKQLKAALEICEIPVCYIDVENGASIVQSVSERLGASAFTVIFATQFYGEDTGVIGNTLSEMKFVLSSSGKGKMRDKYVIKMCENFEFSHTEMCLPSDTCSAMWLPEADGSWGPLPDKIVKEIVAKYQKLEEMPEPLKRASSKSRVPVILESVGTKYTGWSEGAEMGCAYLDRQSVRTLVRSRGVLLRFKLQRQGKDIRYEFDEGHLSWSGKPLSVSEGAELTTNYHVGARAAELSFLRHHTVMVPTGRVMMGFTLQRNGNDIRYAVEHGEMSAGGRRLTYAEGDVRMTCTTESEGAQHPLKYLDRQEVRAPPDSILVGFKLEGNGKYISYRIWSVPIACIA